MCRAVFKSAKARLIVGQDWTYKVIKLFVDNFFTHFANNRKLILEEIPSIKDKLPCQAILRIQILTKKKKPDNLLHVYL